MRNGGKLLSRQPVVTLACAERAGQGWTGVRTAGAGMLAPKPRSSSNPVGLPLKYTPPLLAFRSLPLLLALAHALVPVAVGKRFEEGLDCRAVAPPPGREQSLRCRLGIERLA